MLAAPVGTLLLTHCTPKVNMGCALPLLASGLSMATASGADGTTCQDSVAGTALAMPAWLMHHTAMLYVLPEVRPLIVTRVMSLFDGIGSGTAATIAVDVLESDTTHKDTNTTQLRKHKNTRN